MTRHIVSSFLLCLVGSCLAYGQGTVSGTQYHIGQFTTPAGTTIGNTNSVTDSTGNNLTVPGLLTGKQTNGSVNSDLNGGIVPSIGSCIVGPCTVLVPATSIDSTAMWQQMNASNGQQYQLLDQRGGLNVLFSQNIGTGGQFPNAYGHQCSYGPTGIYGLTNGASGTSCDMDNFLKVGGGVDINNHWTTSAHHQTYAYFNTRGQGINNNSVGEWYEKMYDSIHDEVLGFFRGGCDAFNCEGDKLTAHHWTQQGTIYGNIGTGGGGVPGATVIQLNFGAEQNSYVMDGGYMLFSDEPIGSSTTFTSCVNSPDLIIPELCQTSSTVPVSTWQGTLTSACGALNLRDDKVANPARNTASCTVNVTVSTKAPTAGQAVTLADTDHYEQAKVVGVAPTTGVTGNVTVQLLMTVPHQAGTKVMFGGTAGGFGVFANGQADPTASPFLINTTFPIGGSPDSTHEYVITNMLEGQQGVSPIILPANITTSIGQPLTCSGSGVVTFPAGTISNDLNITPTGIQQYVVSGNSSSPMNGVITGIVTQDDGSGTWTAPGGTCGGSTGGTGGTVTLTHTQEIFEYCGAEVTAIADASMFLGFLRPNGLIHLDNHNCLAASGARAMQPNRTESASTMYSDQYTVFTPGLNGGEAFGTHDINMVRGTIDIYTTSNSLASYHTNGGQNPGVNVANYNLPMSGGWNFQYAPIGGGALFTIGCPLHGCSTHQTDTPLFLASSPGTQGRLYWSGSRSVFLSTTGFATGSSPTQGSGNAFFGPSHGTGYSAMTLSGSFDDVASVKSFIGLEGSDPYFSTDSNLYLHAGNARFGAGAFNFLIGGVTIGSGSLTTFNWPDVTASGVELCRVDGTHCPRPITATNCSSAASPAVCGSAPAGSFVIAAGATSTVVDTTAVTANSQIVVYPDESLGTKLGVTCNTTPATALATTGVTARTAGTSFTITTSGTVATHPACYSYLIVN